MVFFWWLIYYKLRELLKMAIEIVDLPSYKMVIFNSYGTVYQRVSWLLFVSQRAEIYTWSAPNSVYPQSNWWAVWTIPSWFFFTVPNISRPSVAHPPAAEIHRRCWKTEKTINIHKNSRYFGGNAPVFFLKKLGTPVDAPWIFQTPSSIPDAAAHGWALTCPGAVATGEFLRSI